MRRFALLTMLSLLAAPTVAIAQQESSGSGVSPYYAPMQPPGGVAAPGAPDGQSAMQPPPDDQSAVQPPPPDDQAGMQPPPLPPGLQPPDSGGPSGRSNSQAFGHGHDAAMMQKWQQRFDAANTSRDGHLTLDQARAAGMRPIVAHFSAIDGEHRGYVTFNEVMAWRMDQMAQQMERRAAALRAQDGG